MVIEFWLSIIELLNFGYRIIELPGLGLEVTVVLDVGVTEGVGVGFVVELFVGVTEVLVKVGLGLGVTVLFGTVAVLWQVEFSKSSAKMTPKMQNNVFIS